jgi:hypothetical protein
MIMKEKEPIKMELIENKILIPFAFINEVTEGSPSW